MFQHKKSSVLSHRSVHTVITVSRFANRQCVSDAVFTVRNVLSRVATDRLLGFSSGNRRSLCPTTTASPRSADVGVASCCGGSQGPYPGPWSVGESPRPCCVHELLARWRGSAEACRRRRDRVAMAWGSVVRTQVGGSGGQWRGG